MAIVVEFVVGLDSSFPNSKFLSGLRSPLVCSLSLYHVICRNSSLFKLFLSELLAIRSYGHFKFSCPYLVDSEFLDCSTLLVMVLSSLSSRIGRFFESGLLRSTVPPHH